MMSLPLKSFEMKKLFILITTLTAFALSCDPPEWTETHYSRWYIKNIQDYPIIFNTDSTRFALGPDDSLCILRMQPFRKDGEPVFNLIWNYVKGIDISVSVTDTDTTGQVLAEWNKNDIHAIYSFYNELNWKKYSEFLTETQLSVKWVFECAFDE